MKTDALLRCCLHKGHCHGEGLACVAPVARWVSVPVVTVAPFCTVEQRHHRPIMAKQDLGGFATPKTGTCRVFSPVHVQGIGLCVRACVFCLVVWCVCVCVCLFVLVLEIRASVRGFVFVP